MCTLAGRPEWTHQLLLALRFTEANSPEGQTSPGNPPGQMEKGYYNYFTPWDIAGSAQRSLSSSRWDVRVPSFGKGLSPKTAGVILCSEHRSRWQRQKMSINYVNWKKSPFPCFCRTQHTGLPPAIGTFFLAAVSVVK